ncbi:phosphatidylserine decarboxylase family protein [bacterium]|nr:phosphatidylserine decarboxylase family protein [bacterium]
MIHKEGYTTLLVAGLVLAVIAFLGLKFVPRPWSFLFLAFSVGFFLFFMQFFRNPVRIPPNLPNSVISPADGKVVVIEKVFEKRFFNKEMMQVSIFMSPFNVHVNRVPFDGKVVFSKYHEGKYLVAFHPKSSELNESTTVVYEHEKLGTQVMVRQIAGAVARRIVCYMKEGMEVKAGDEMGFIKFGSRADIFLPLDAEIKVKLGDVCTGSITEIASLK